MIDQEKILVDLFSHELARDKIHVVSAANIADARMALTHIHPDLIILDPDIPDGTELLTEMRSAEYTPAIIALTHSTGLHQNGAAYGVNHVIDRSQGFAKLFEAIQACLKLQVQPKADQIQVLVVDDEQESLTMLTYALQERGYAVLTATGGNQALEMFERNPDVSLVLLDVRMPDRGGMEVLKEVRARNSRLGVIMLTAISDREIAQQAIILGAYDYLVKPINLLTLENAMDACLSHAEYQQRPWWKRLIS